MPSFQCSYCSRTFASAYALKRHISDKHRNLDISDNDDDGPSEMPYEEPGLGLIMMTMLKLQKYHIKKNLIFGILIMIMMILKIKTKW